ncbi:MAG: ATP-binding protein [Sideroxydans sp.]
MDSLFSLFRFEIDADNLDVRRDQLRARIALYPTMILPAMAISWLLVWLMWGAVPQGWLLGWLITVNLVHAVELIQWWSRRDQCETLEQCRRWNRLFHWHTGSAGLVWGAAWLIMFVPGELAYQVLLICLAMGFVSAAIAMNPVHPPSVLTYTVAQLLPLMLRLAWENDKAHWFLVLMLLVYLVVLLDAAKRLMVNFERLVRQRFEKVALLTELRQREKETTEALEKAEQANREKSRFLAAASHDLRQPLQALRLFTEALQDAAGTPEIERLAGQIGKSVDALGAMFDDLLDISRLDAGIIEPRYQHFHLFDLFDRLYVDFAVLAQSKGLLLNLPTGKECDAVVHSDPFLLERMLRNLLSNAIRYTGQGEVSIHCRLAGQRIELAVSDTGIGIRPEALAQIFDEYYQADNPHRDRRKGLGLGLAIVRRIECLLDYRIEVASVPGEGSTFRFTVPCGDPAQRARPYLITQAQQEVGGTTIAFVEDDADIRESTAELMRHWGCTVFAAEEVATVLRELDRSAARPDLLLSDYRLPHRQTALDVMRQVRERWGNVPTLVLTGDTGRETLQAIRASGATLLHKPIAPARLRAAMHLLLAGARVI